MGTISRTAWSGRHQRQLFSKAAKKRLSYCTTTGASQQNMNPGAPSIPIHVSTSASPPPLVIGGKLVRVTPESPHGSRGLLVNVRVRAIG